MLIRVWYHIEYDFRIECFQPRGLPTSKITGCTFQFTFVLPNPANSVGRRPETDNCGPNCETRSIECSQTQNICGGDPTPPDQLTCSRVICTLGLSVTDSATTQSEPAHETPARGPSSAAADQPAKPAGAVAAAIPGPFPCLSYLLSSPRLGRAAASMATSSAEVNPWRCRVPTPSL